MLALSIRQPYAELILRGIKTIEYRTRPTRIIGRRFHLYAARAKANVPVWSDDLEAGTPPGWMIELARQVSLIAPGTELPMGVIVGSAVIEKCEAIDGRRYAWHLTDVKRLARPRGPRGRPQPVWWRDAG